MAVKDRFLAGFIPVFACCTLLVAVSPASGGAGAGRQAPPLSGGHTGTGEVPAELLFSDSYEPLWTEMDDPRRDGWNTEVFNNDAGKQLKKLGKLITHPEDIDEEHLAALFTEDSSCDPLRPDNLVRVFEDDAIRVDRGGNTVAPGREREEPCRGYSGLARALKKLAQPFFDASEVRFKFKLFRVAPDGESVTTKQYFAVTGRTATGMLEQNATWVARWRAPAQGELPRIQWVGVEQFEEVTTRAPEGPLFSDCTESALRSDPSFETQILRGYGHWLERIENTRDWALLGTPGIAVGDVNGDGLEDLYLCQEQGLPNRLFLQNPDGTARDAAAPAGVDWLQDCRSVLLVDLDNDGDQDLVVGVLGSLVLAANDGNGAFAIRTLLPTSDDTMSASAADYDNDGDLDLYVTGYHPDKVLERVTTPEPTGAASTFVYHDANNGAPNLLFRNDTRPGGTWEFTDVTNRTGLDMNNHRFSFVGVWEDYDNDGDQDLYVANDYGRDNLYRNDPGEAGDRRFVDIGDTANAEDDAGGMSATWGDYNRDGWMDMFVSNMWSSAGNRITFQPGFKPETPESIKSRFQGFARGNTLLKGDGEGGFEDVSGPAGIEMGRWAWGSRFADLNNDGWEDVVVANGYLTGDPKGGDL